MAADWVPGVLSGAAGALLGAGASMWKHQAVIDQIVKSFKADLERIEKQQAESEDSLGRDLKDACHDLREVVTDVRAMTAEQAIVNQVTNKALEGIVLKLDMHASTLNEHGATISLIRELLNSSRKPEKH